MRGRTVRLLVYDGDGQLIEREVQIQDWTGIFIPGVAISSGTEIILV
jgi:hypothetical protein